MFVIKKRLLALLAASVFVFSGLPGVVTGEDGFDAEFYKKASELSDLTQVSGEIESEPQDEYILGQLIVRTKNGQRLKNTRGAIGEVRRSDGLYLLQYSDSEAAKQAQALLDSEDMVEYAAPNALFRLDSTQTELDAAVYPDNFPYCWGKDRIKADILGSYISNVKREVIVAVIDSGADIDHPFFAGRLVEGYNALDGSNDVTDLTDPSLGVFNSHGTHVAGIILNCTPENVKVMPIKAFGADVGSTLDVIAGIDYAAANGANVINMSLGADISEVPEASKPVEDAVTRAVSRNITVVASAGNSGEDIKNYIPARYDNVITVTAIHQNGTFASFSNYGSAVDLCAPGVYIWSSVVGGGYDTKSGTSMASPFIAAAAAMVLSENPEYSPQIVKSKLQSVADPLGDAVYYGAGLIDLEKYKDILFEERSEFRKQNVTVILLIRDYILGQAQLTPAEKTEYDYNNDGIINIFDMITLRNIILRRG